MWGVALMVRVQGGYHQDSAAAARVWGDATYPARVRVLLGAQGQMEDWATGTLAQHSSPCKPTVCTVSTVTVSTVCGTLCVTTSCG